MKKTPILFILIIMVLAFTLSSCKSDSKSQPEEATLAYLNALAEKDKTKVISLSCKTWEEQASLEVDALLSVGANLKDVQCKKVGSENGYQLVNCSGKLDLTYNDEIRAIDLNARTYSMAIEDGRWRVCSYK